MSLSNFLANRCFYIHRIYGSNNRVILGKHAKLFGYVEMRGENNRIILGEGAFVSGRIFVKGSGLKVSVGVNTSMRQGYILVQEGADLTIGSDCLISRDVEIRTSDAHSLVDMESGKRVNPAQPVAIGDHVWIGARSFISKGASIPDKSVVGAMSFVNKHFEGEGHLLAGVPARIVRSGITWHRERRRRFDRDDL